jgi:hypothetical protein
LSTNREPSQKFSRLTRSLRWKTPSTLCDAIHQPLDRCLEPSRWVHYSEIIRESSVEGKVFWILGDEVV